MDTCIVCTYVLFGKRVGVRRRLAMDNVCRARLEAKCLRSGDITADGALVMLLGLDTPACNRVDMALAHLKAASAVDAML